ncbi:autophagy-related protein 23-like, partial [Stegodyphus dumicola]|uniref:autophagy-related protein 23-like n=1 Tax=Stegodyphus dumicola TaxID=202533 RepID=UPI0015A7BF13
LKKKKNSLDVLVSSLPQGWHSVPGSSRNSASTASASAASSVPTIRKKWNSPLSSEVPRSKLPSYKSSNLRLQNGYSSSTATSRISKSSCTAPQSQLPSCPPKPSPIKEYQSEIIKLKKELATMKAENSILKAKVRRVDDENVQKTKQIEKLRVELKALQKNESASNKKSKESELLLLRQKCLRLEGALKEKELALKRFTNVVSLKTGECGDTDKTFHKENEEDIGSKAQKVQETKVTEKSSAAQTSISRTSHSIKTEVAKLRDMIHKLEKENQELQQQAKVNGQEVRRLKMQLKNKDRFLSQQASIPKHSVQNEPLKTEVIKTVPNTTKTLKETSTSLKFVKAPVGKKPLPQNVSKTFSKVEKSALKRNSEKQDALKNEKSTVPSVGAKNFASKKQVRKVSKLPVTKTGSTFVVTKPIVHKSSLKQNQQSHIPVEINVEEKIQEMRENFAAKKIQRSWRNHQKRNLARSGFQNVEKAMAFIVSSMKHHRQLKEKLNLLIKTRNLLNTMQKNDNDDIVHAVQLTVKKVWEKE